MRLQKFLSASGICSRRAGERHILAGRVAVNGKVVSLLGSQVDPSRDRVTFDGQPVALVEDKVCIALHKPLGYVSSCRQPGERLVTDLVNLPRRLIPVGRLDKDSTGLMILTDDGPLHHLLSHPSFDHEKSYQVTTDKRIPNSALDKLAKGVLLDGRPTRPARVKRLGARRFQIVLKEGRNRQIRRMVGGIGLRVVTLHRTRVAHIALGGMAPGKWRHLGARERAKLLALRSASQV